jgi:hypothetical protein
MLTTSEEMESVDKSSCNWILLNSRSVVAFFFLFCNAHSLCFCDKLKAGSFENLSDEMDISYSLFSCLTVVSESFFCRYFPLFHNNTRYLDRSSASDIYLCGVENKKKVREEIKKN